MLLGILISLSALAALLLVPVEFVFAVRRHPSLQTDLCLHWMFGFVEFPSKAAAGSTRSGSARRARMARRLLRLSGALVSEALRLPLFRRRLLRLGRDVAAFSRLRDFRVRLRLGLDDPADTGRIWAWMGPLIVFLQAQTGSSLDIEVDFEHEALEVDLEGKIRIVPARMVFLAAAFVLSPVTLWTAWTHFARP